MHRNSKWALLGGLEKCVGEYNLGLCQKVALHIIPPNTTPMTGVSFIRWLASHQATTLFSFFILALPPLIFARSAARVADLPISLLHFYFDGRQKGYQCKRRIYVLATGPSPLLWNNRRSNFLALEIYLFLKNANTLKIMSTTNQCNDVQAFRVSVERRLCQRLSIKLHMS